MMAQSVRVTRASAALRRRADRPRLLWSCAVTAIAAAATQPQAAKAQEVTPLGAFRGSITGEPANVSRGSMTSTSETITISAPKAVIDWSASQTDFLPAGNVATFLGSGVSDFTVLNRINADGQQIQVNGTVLGRLQGQANTPAGKIWFYSPGGILVGASAVFDVGGLVLTANDPVGFANSTTGFGQFTADGESNASVIISQGAQINAMSGNSYVALIAPRVEQHGTVNVNGAAAYAAGQQVTMTVNQGLFNIAVDVGTEDPNGIIHSGTTTGPAGTGANDRHQIYMVAVPKNETLTMLLGGSIGFASAVNAEVENGDIVLSSGGKLAIGPGTYSSNLLGTASGDISVTNKIYASDLELRAAGSITTGDIEADGIFTALALGNMSFGDVVADEVYLARFVATAPGSGALVGTCVGNCGILGPDGVVTAPPGGTSYTYVTTNGGVSGAGQLPGEGGTNGSDYTTSPFSADAGDELIFGFNYVTSDGSGFADYAWAALYTETLDPVAILYTARTQPSGTIVPGQDLPGVEATLNPSSVPIIPGGPEWAPLGSDSGDCFAAGCGYTGWVNSTYEIADAGNYVLKFGVSNWSDTGFQSGMAFSGITVGGVPVEGGPVRTGGSITIGDVNTGRFTAAAGTTLTAGVIDSSGGISIDAGGAIITNNLFAGGLIIGDAGGGITIQNESSAPSIEIGSDASVTTGNIDSADGVIIRSDGWIATGDVDAIGDIDLEAVGTITTADTTAGGAVHFDADGNIELGDATAGESISLDSGGTITAGSMDAATDVVATAGSDFLLADVLAEGSIALTANGLAQFVGLVSAPEITVTSGDITIADGASLGEAGVTEVLNLVAVSESAVLIGSGDDAGQGQYTLDEDGDIVAETVNVTAQSDVIVRNVQIEGSETSGGGVSHVNLTSDGNVVVTGVVDYTKAGDADTLAITAGGSIQVVTDTGGGISMTDSDGDLAGMLELTAHDIWVADADLLEQLNGNPNFAGRDDALALNNSQVVQDGYIRAGGVTATMLGSSFFVQNSGTKNEPAGISVGQGGLTIVNEGTEPASVTIFGKQFNQNGTATVGDDFFGEVQFAGTGGFGEGSTVNGCEVGGGCAPDAPPFDGGAESILGPVGLMDSPMGDVGGMATQSESEAEDEEEQSAESIAASLGLISTGSLTTQQLIDDPVTSGSDSGQWDGNLESNPGEQ